MVLGTSLDATNENYIPPIKIEIWDGYIPLDRRKDCIQNSKYSVTYDKNHVKKQYDKWNKLNTGTYVYIYNDMGQNGRILFVKNGEVQKSIRENCRQEHRGFQLGPYTCKYQLRNMVNKDRTEKSFIARRQNKIQYMIDERFKSALKRDLSEKKYCIQTEWRLTYNEKYGYISSLETEKPNCRCTPKPLKYNNYFYYGLLMLPKNTQFTDDVVKKILNKYDKAWECERLILSYYKRDKSKLTILERRVGREKLECLDKYLVWDENEPK